MDQKSGSIAAFENEDDAKKAGYTIPLENEEAVELLKMPRDERVAARIRALSEQLKQIEQTKLLSRTEKAVESNLAIDAEFDRWAAEEAKKHG